MALFKKKEEEKEVEPVKIEPAEVDKEEVSIMVQALLDDPEVKAYIAVTNGARKYKVVEKLLEK